MKSGIRILGIDDASFDFESKSTFLTGVVYRGTDFIEDIQTIEVEIDGDEATEKVLKLYKKISNHQQVKALLLDSITFGGLNVVDLEKLSEKTSLPVIAVTKNKPDREGFKETLEETGNYTKVLNSLDEPSEIDLESGSCYIQFSGCSREEAEKLVKTNITHGQVPESIRVADMIGRALK